MNCARRISLIVAVTGTAVALRIVLGLGAPEAAPFGYVYDFYHEPILFLHEKGVLPDPGDCWQCYQPPLFTVVGHAIFAVGMKATSGDIDASLRLLSWFSMFVSLAFLGLAFLVVGHFVKDKRQLAALTAFLVSLPCIFISSYAVESDLFCATLMLGAFYLYLRYAGEVGSGSRWDNAWVVISMAILSGMAALTKYSGLVIIAVLALLLVYQVLRDRSHRRRRLAHAGLYLAIAVVAGAGDLLANVIERGELITGNRAWKQKGKSRALHLDVYEFDSFQLRRLVKLMHPDAKPGELKRFSVYNESVWSSHYGQIYTDCSIFSNPTRHGLRKGLYPAKEIPVVLVATLLGAGLVPVLLGLTGLVFAIGHPREHLPLFVLATVMLTLYTRWFLSYPEWMLKTKYFFVLVPVALVFCARGLTVARSVHPRLEQFLQGWIWLVAGLGITYGIFFAVT